MRLKLANPMAQRQIVYYRLDFNFFGEPDAGDRFRAPKSMPVEGGRQIALGGDLAKQQVDSIIKQLEVYGAIMAEHQGKLPPHQIPYILSIDKDVPAKIIRDVFLHNQGILTLEGKERRTNAAIVANDAVEKALDTPLDNFEVEIEEQQPEAGEPERKTKLLSEGLRVTRKEPGDKPAKRAAR